MSRSHTAMQCTRGPALRGPLPCSSRIFRRRPAFSDGRRFRVLTPALPSLSTDVLQPDTVQSTAYAALGLGAASFVTTFFVLPRFYTRNPDWNAMLPALRAAGVRTVTPREAYARSRSAVLLDVRLADKFAEIAPARAVNVPLYVPIANWDIPSIIRRIGFAFFGVAGTELNPGFLDEVRAIAPKGKEILVICEAGGSIQPKPGNDAGFQSRSLKAVYYLQQAGLKVAHVDGGVAAWVRDGLPTSADSDDDADGGVGAFDLAAAVRSLSLLPSRP